MDIPRRRFEHDLRASPLTRTNYLRGGALAAVWLLLLVILALGVAKQGIPHPLHAAPADVLVRSLPDGRAQIVRLGVEFPEELYAESGVPSLGPFGETVTIEVVDGAGTRSTRDVVRAPFAIVGLARSLGVPEPIRLAGLLVAFLFYSQIVARLAAAIAMLLLAPRHPTALAISASWLCNGLLVDTHISSAKLWPTRGLMVIGCLVGCVSVLSFPDGRMTPRRWAFAACATVAWAGFSLHEPGPVHAMFVVSVMLALVADLAWRAWRGGAALRQQALWVATGVLLGAAHLALGNGLASLGYTNLAALAQLASPFVGLLSMGCVMVAIVRYRLWDLSLAVGQAGVLAVLGGILVSIDFAIGTLGSAVLAPLLGDDLFGGGAGYAVAFVAASLLYPRVRAGVRAVFFPRLLVLERAVEVAGAELDLTWRREEVLKQATRVLATALDSEVSTIERHDAGWSVGTAMHGDLLDQGEWAELVEGDGPDVLLVPLGRGPGAVGLRIAPPTDTRGFTTDERVVLEGWIERVQVALMRADLVCTGG